MMDTAVEGRHYAIAAWGGSLSVFVTGTDEWLMDIELGWHDPEDYDNADDWRVLAITDTLAKGGWEPVPDAEWQHIAGTPGREDGAERVPVRRSR